MMIITIKDNQIINVGNPLPTNNPEPGGPYSDGSYIVYLEDLDGLEPNDFLEQRYWDGTNFLVRAPRPSLYCIWNGSSWILDEPNYLKQLRWERDMLLYRCDWTQLPDAPLTIEQQQEALTYRQALRDMVAIVEGNISNCLTIEDAPWPTPPTFLA